MPHLYKAAEFEILNRFYVNDPEIKDSLAPYWWIPARILNISPANYLELLVKTFKASKVTFDNNVLIFSFDTLEDARKYKNYINAAARKENYII